MRKIIMIKLISAFLVTPAMFTPAQAQRATEQQALTVAQNWINLIVSRYDQWGGHPEAEAVLVQEFKRGERILGYYCQVAPQGYIIVSLYQSLAPVQAYSDTGNLNPFNETGLTDLIKDKMEKMQQDVEQVLGADIRYVQADQWEDVLEINYQSVWVALLDGDFDSSAYHTQDDYQIAAANYQPGQVMVETSWHQDPPYNNDCPGGSCSWPNYGFFNTNTLVGCVATAGAQIMRYWNWPPFPEGYPNDPYDWPNMRRRYVYNGAGWFNDENGTSVTWAQINAVAELCSEVGQAVDMNYGCGLSSAPTYDMEGVYKDQYMYNDNCDKVDRKDYSASSWFDMLKYQFDRNRPVQYRLTDHSVVGDGWQEIAGLKQYHMNYGWDNNNNAWWTLDALNLGGVDIEYVVRDIYPEWALGGAINGVYSTLGRWYIDQDTGGSFATFGPDVDFQFLKPGLTITGAGTGGAGNEVRFSNTTAYAPVRFFLHGDPAGQTRIKITDGAIKLTHGGQLTIR